MKSLRVRLLALALVLTGAVFAAAPRSASAACTRFCWLTVDGACCRLTTCEIVCSPS